MLLLYSILLSMAFLIMSPMFLVRREKYASGFSQRLGNYPEFKHDGRDVIWLHCVSVGETNAARPLVDALRKEFPNHRLVISTTTRTGQKLAQKIFDYKADAIFYFPFDFKFSVRRALETYKPSLVLLMETEIWPRFIHEAKLSGAKIAIVNGRLSQRSFDRYSRVRSFVSRVLAKVDLALMQDKADAKRIARLGIDPTKVALTGNLKFDVNREDHDRRLADQFRDRFRGSNEKILVIAASTHPTEEQIVLDALKVTGADVRLIVAPRHPERFDEVEKLLEASGSSVVRRSDSPLDSDKIADVIMLDSLGELAAAYEISDLAIVGGSFIPHGGQNVLEPAAAGKPIVTGPYTHNFNFIVQELAEKSALIQVREGPLNEFPFMLSEALQPLLVGASARAQLGDSALSVVKDNQGATAKTVDQIRTRLFLE